MITSSPSPSPSSQPADLWDVFHADRLEVERGLSSSQLRAALAEQRIRDDDLARPAGTTLPWTRIADLPELAETPAAPQQQQQSTTGLVEPETRADEHQHQPEHAPAPTEPAELHPPTLAQADSLALPTLSDLPSREISVAEPGASSASQPLTTTSVTEPTTTATVIPSPPTIQADISPPPPPPPLLPLPMDSAEQRERADRVEMPTVFEDSLDLDFGVEARLDPFGELNVEESWPEEDDEDDDDLLRAEAEAEAAAPLEVKAAAGSIAPSVSELPPDWSADLDLDLDPDLEQVAEVEEAAIEENFTLARSAVRHVEELDLAPMVDVAFQLVLFFLVTASTLVYKTIEVPRPNPDSPPEVVAQGRPKSVEELEKDYILVEIDARGGIQIDHEPIAPELSVLCARLRSARQQTGRTVMLVKADVATKHRSVVLTYDAASEIDMRISLTIPSKVDGEPSG